MVIIDALEVLFVVVVGTAEIEGAKTLVGVIGVYVDAIVLVQGAIDLS